MCPLKLWYINIYITYIQKIHCANIQRPGSSCTKLLMGLFPQSWGGCVDIEDDSNDGCPSLQKGSRAARSWDPAVPMILLSHLLCSPLDSTKGAADFCEYLLFLLIISTVGPGLHAVAGASSSVN